MPSVPRVMSLGELGISCAPPAPVSHTLAPGPQPGTPGVLLSGPLPSHSAGLADLGWTPWCDAPAPGAACSLPGTRAPALCSCGRGPPKGLLWAKPALTSWHGSPARDLSPAAHLPAPCPQAAGPGSSSSSPGTSCPTGTSPAWCRCCGRQGTDPRAEKRGTALDSANCCLHHRLRDSGSALPCVSEQLGRSNKELAAFQGELKSLSKMRPKQKEGRNSLSVPAA